VEAYMSYQLPKEQVREAEVIADEITSARGDSPGKWGQDLAKSPMDRRNGLLAEFSVRWAFGMPTWDRSSYPPFSEKDKADVGDNCEVRQTTHERGRLPLHRDHDDVIPKIERDYALVILVGSQFRLPGWLPMSIAMEYWYEVEFQPGRPCMAVDQDQLYPIEDLVIEEKGKKYEVQGVVQGPKCMGCGKPAAPCDGYCGTCWFEYVYRPRKFGHIPGGGK